MPHEPMVVAADCAGNGCGDIGDCMAVPVDVGVDGGCVALNKLASDKLHEAPSMQEVQYAVCRFYDLTPTELDEMPWDTVMKMYEAAIR